MRHGAPGSARLSGRDGDGAWFEILPLTELQPDTRHRFRIYEQRPVTAARLDVYPDGGMARVRLFGSLTETGLAEVCDRWAVSA